MRSCDYAVLTANREARIQISTIYLLLKHLAWLSLINYAFLLVTSSFFMPLSLSARVLSVMLGWTGVISVMLTLPFYLY
jgi:hypothetical protein